MLRDQRRRQRALTEGKAGEGVSRRRVDGTKIATCRQRIGSVLVWMLVFGGVRFWMQVIKGKTKLLMSLSVECLPR